MFKTQETLTKEELKECLNRRQDNIFEQERVKLEVIDKIESTKDIEELLYNSTNNCTTLFNNLGIKLKQKPLFVFYNVFAPNKEAFAEADYNGKTVAYFDKNKEKVLKQNKINPENFVEIKAKGLKNPKDRDVIIYYTSFIKYIQNDLNFKSLPSQFFSDNITIHEFAHFWQRENNILYNNGLEEVISSYFEKLHERLYAGNNKPLFRGGEKHFKEGNRIVTRVLGKDWNRPELLLEKTVRDEIEIKCKEKGILEEYRKARY